MSTTHSFWDVIKERRTYYALNKEAPTSDDRIIELVRDAILHMPSAFNSQSARLIVLLKADHDKFWELVKEVLKPIVPTEVFPTTEKKINKFKAGYGTVRLHFNLSLKIS
jgi:predicted oxidoreductase (fatty acid repression mutant protein)